ncbi:MAG: hypothetical protein M1828_001504 [Chrysothrix sp. TS-e1954]|nr:MAG: hypothetical protein M1828_001504 [Chrysothrix sp. TS-e1954]
MAPRVPLKPISPNKTVDPVTEAMISAKRAVQSTNPPPAPASIPPAHTEPGFDSVRIDKTCDQVRKRLQNLLDNNEYKTKKALLEDMDVSGPSFNRFMGQHGRDKGSESDAFLGGLKLLQRRAEQGLKDPRAKPASGGKKRTSDASDRESGSAKKTQTAGAKQEGAPDVSGIHLDGAREDGEGVPVFDTCDELRRKINAHLKLASVTQASFLRALSAQTPQKVSAQTLNTFRHKHGSDAGKGSTVFYPAYVYFEKLRVTEGKRKGKLREEMEGIWGAKGWAQDRHSLHDDR